MFVLIFACLAAGADGGVVATGQPSADQSRRARPVADGGDDGAGPRRCVSRAGWCVRGWRACHSTHSNRSMLTQPGGVAAERATARAMVDTQAEKTATERAERAAAALKSVQRRLYEQSQRQAPAEGG